MLESLTTRLQDHFGLFSAAMFLCLAVWETVWPARPSVGPLVWRWTANFAFFVTNAVLFSLLVTPNRVMGWLGSYGITVDGPVAALGFVAGAWPVLLCGALVSDLFLYVAHRAEHGVFLLWRMHLVHHSDGELDASTGFRHYPGEVGLHVLIGTAIFVALGIPAWGGLAYGMITYVVGVTQHANVRLFSPAVDHALQCVLVTPDMHRIHHSVSRVEHDSNYGNILSIWDHLFGTYRAASVEEQNAMTFGVSGFGDTSDARPDRVALQPFRLPRETQRTTWGNIIWRRQTREAANKCGGVTAATPPRPARDAADRSDVPRRRAS